VLFCGLLNSGIPFALFSFALQHINTGLSSILNATVPLFGALVAWPGWGRTRRLAQRGLLVGFVGVALLAWDKVGAGRGGGPWPPGPCWPAWAPRCATRWRPASPTNT
jgi:drug/metabolite transporter (DMT)-like permease